MSFKPIPADYDPGEAEFATFNDGSYKARSIEWFTVDEQDRPLLVVQKNGARVARYHLILEDGTQGPPGSCSASEAKLIARAFGVNVSQLPDYEEDHAGSVSEYLSQVEALIEQQNKVVSVKVFNGWVNSIKGAELPTGMYDVKLVSILKPKDQTVPHWIEGKFGKYCVFTFEVTNNPEWAGTQVTQIVSYALKADTTKTPPELGWETMKNSNDPSRGAVQMSTLITLFAPEVFSGVTFADYENILPEFLGYAVKNGAVVRMLRQPNSKNTSMLFNITTAELVTDVKVVQQVEASNPDEDARQVFKRMVSTLGGEVCFSSGFNLNALGKKVAKEYLVPLKEKKVIGHGNIPLFTAQDVLAIAEALEMEEFIAELKGEADEVGEAF